MITETHTNGTPMSAVSLVKINTVPLVRTITDSGHSLQFGSWMLKSNDLDSLHDWFMIHSS